MDKEQKQEFARRITQANSTQLVVVLYDMALYYCEEACENNKNGDQNGFQSSIRSAKSCVEELMASLHMEYEQAMNLSKLYFYCLRRLAAASYQNKSEPIDEIKNVLKPLRDAYDTIVAQNPSGPVMENAQTVYTGFGYGRNSLATNITDQGTNRGLYI